MNSVPSY